MRSLVALVAILSACATGPTIVWDRLSDDEAAWSRCQRIVADHLCGATTNATNLHSRAACVLHFVDELQAQATPAARRGWLISNGCPAPLVSPEQVVVDRWEAENATAGAPSARPSAAPGASPAAPRP